MHALIACSTFAVAVTLAVRRPQLGPHVQVTPAMAAATGVLCLLAAGTVRITDLTMAFETLWRPLVAILSIMVTTAAAREVGVINAVASRFLMPRVVSVQRVFRGVFVLSLITASILSNDAAILLLTPIVIAFVRQRYPDRPRLVLPFAFAVFMAAGVAPFVTSNPMNMVVASYVGLNFNTYAVVMLPVALAGSVVTLVLLGRVFAADLSEPATPACADARPMPFSPAARRMLLLVGAVTATYPVVALVANGAIWAVAAVGAVAAVALVWREHRSGVAGVIGRGVSWDVLIFLPAVFVLTIGLRNVGLVEVLTAWYRDAGVIAIGATAAIGSAALNNHPMALINMLALDARPDAGALPYLAALVGGDLGPRLLPTGSLAGLLWIESCHRLGVHIAPGLFVRVGFILTVPTLLLSLLLLGLL